MLLGLTLVATGAARPTSAEAAAVATPPPPTATPVSPQRLYGLWCISCHGDTMRGLTPEWIAKWPATHQNCWVAKCHGSNPPPDGFSIPRTAPAIAGPGALLKFRTAADLFAYVRAVMPFQEPGVLEDEQYYAILGYILDRHGVEVPPEGLSAVNAGQIILNEGAVDSALSTERPSSPIETPAADATPGGASGSETGREGMDPTLSAVAVLLGVVVGVGLFLRRRPRRPSGGG